MNEHNANMFRHIDGMGPLGTLILAQRLPADKLGGKTGNQIGPDGKIMEQESTRKADMLSLYGYIDKKNWLRPNGQVITMGSYEILYKTISNYLKDEESVKDFLRNPNLLRKITLSAEDLHDSEHHHASYFF